MIHNYIKISMLAALMAAKAWALPELSVSIEAESFYEGQGFEMRVSAVSGQPPAEVQLEESAAFYVQPLRDAISEDGEQRLYLYRYRLIPRRDGLLQIPQVQMNIGGDYFMTEPEVIRVLSARSSDRLKLEMHLERTTCSIGEAVLLTGTWYTALPLREIKALDLAAPVLSSPAWRILIPASEHGLSGEKTIGLPVEGQRIICRVRDIDIDGRAFKAITFKRLLVPLEPGHVQLPPLRLLCSHMGESGRGGTSYPSYFDNNFFHAVEGAQPYTRYGVQSQPAELTINPLPEGGRPLAFSGIVGACTLEVSLTPDRLRLGEPLQVTLTLKGHPHPEALALPVLSSLGELDALFVLPEDIGEGRVQDGARVYRFAAVPRRCAVRSFPALTLSYLNTETLTYGQSSSPPIPLSVAPDGPRTELEIDDAEDLSLPHNPEGLWHNLPSHEPGWKVRLAWALRGLSPLWLLLPPLAYLAGIRPARLAQLRRSDPRRARRLCAYRELTRKLRSSEDPRAAVSDYFAAHLDCRAGSLTLVDIHQALAAQKLQPRPELSALLQQLYHHADITRYDGMAGGGTYKFPLKDLRAELGRLEKEWRS